MDIMNIVYISLAVILVVIIVILFDYNKLIRLQNRVKKSASTIEIKMNQRFDLIPNFVECVKGYSKHEKDTLTEITNLRSRYNETSDMNEANRINNDLSKLLAVVESYPELKANSNFLELQQQLSKIENEISQTRIIYNNEVTAYNTAIESVPSNIVAGMFNFTKADLFKIEEDKKENIKVGL